jgi:DNA-binding MarR family transcriptional regulator|tara:strand:- start:1283 stop:1477 length:195 start_codon:yes stop_codon:yes gene_type:complete
MSINKGDAVLSAVPSDGWYTTDDIRNRSGYSPHTLDYWLKKLVKLNKVARRQIASTRENLWRRI